MRQVRTQTQTQTQTETPATSRHKDKHQDTRHTDRHIQTHKDKHIAFTLAHIHTDRHTAHLFDGLDGDGGVQHALPELALHATLENARNCNQSVSWHARTQTHTDAHAQTHTQTHIQTHKPTHTQGQDAINRANRKSRLRHISLGKDTTQDTHTSRTHTHRPQNDNIVTYGAARARIATGRAGGRARGAWSGGVGGIFECWCRGC